jgi:hypothetical protein
LSLRLALSGEQVISPQALPAAKPTVHGAKLLEHVAPVEVIRARSL